MSPADHTPRYLDELKPGLVICSDPLGELLNMEDIKTFARQFDPQPFHLDEVAAEKTLFGGLAASGWHTAAVTMRLLVDGGLPLAGGIIGAGVEEIRWPHSVRPGRPVAHRERGTGGTAVALEAGTGHRQDPGHDVEPEQ